MVVAERLVGGGQHDLGHLLAPVQVVGPVAQHLGLDDGHDSVGL